MKANLRDNLFSLYEQWQTIQYMHYNKNLIAHVYKIIQSSRKQINGTTEPIARPICFIFIFFILRVCIDRSKGNIAYF